jgi:transcriptional regulator with XRE-family HTH domain
MGGSPDDADARMGANVRSLREGKGISQAELARRMSEAGYPWHQSTVGRAEAGRQSVRASEAEALARIFGVTVDRLLWAGPEAAEAAMASAAVTRLRTEWRALSLAAARLHDARSAAGRAAKRADASEYPRVRIIADGLAEDLADCTLDAALEEGAAITERDADG